MCSKGVFMMHVNVVGVGVLCQCRTRRVGVVEEGVEVWGDLALTVLAVLIHYSLEAMEDLRQTNSKQ